MSAPPLRSRGPRSPAPYRRSGGHHRVGDVIGTAGLALLLAILGLVIRPGVSSAASGANLPVPDTTDLVLEPCQLAGIDRPARCGTYEVWEDREAESGRRIPLRVVVLPARQRPARPDPVFYLAGGPGGSATRSAPFFADDAVGARRDLVFLDQRGTGGSHPLDCTGDSFQATAEAILAGRMTPELLEECRASLDADPTHYTTARAVDDLEEVRAALGYDRINLFGTSYGTRAALVYARRHPASVRSLILRGAAPIPYRVPLPFARGSQAALEALFDSCTERAACASSFGDLRSLLTRVTEAVERERPSASLTVPGRGEAALTLDAEMLRGTVLFSLYDTSWSARLPALLEAGDEGDFEPLVRWSAFLAFVYDRELSLGAFLSVVCAEDDRRITPAEIQDAARETYLGDGWIRGVLGGCETWPAGPVPKGFFEPTRIDAPVLVISGAADPVTPPSWGQELTDRLPAARHLVFPGVGHQPVWPGCSDEVALAFLERGGVEGLDTACVQPIPRPAFRSLEEASALPGAPASGG